MNILTIVSARLDQTRSDDIVAAYKELLDSQLPEGLLQTQLVSDGKGHWAIHSRWRDRASLEAMRASGEPPAAPALLKRLGGEPELQILQVVVDSASE